MCLITICSGAMPSVEDMEKAHRSNGDGMGIAWRENGMVRFVKGIKEVKMLRKVMEALPFPYVLHYRWASIGGKCRELCHPFPLTEGVELDTKGTAKEVLFHNGHFSDWKEMMRGICISRNEKIPKGEWSDTRAIAWAVARFGETFLNTIDGKFVFFSKKLCRYYGEGWTVEEEGKIIHSNKTWSYGTTVYNHGAGGCGFSSGYTGGGGTSYKSFHDKKKEQEDKEKRLLEGNGQMELLKDDRTQAQKEKDEEIEQMKCMFPDYSGSFE